MKRRKYGLLILLLWTSLLVLQGCGGDDGGFSISQDMYEALRINYEQAVADRDAAASAQMTAEAEAKAAMEQQMEAEAGARTAIQAQRAAETLRDRAVAAQAVAEEARAVAETASLKARAAARAAIEAQETAEDEAAAVKRNKVAAEAALSVATSTATDARQAQTRVEAAQLRAEAAQAEAEKARTMAEAAARIAVEARSKAEEDLKAALANQLAAEAAQETAEADMTTAKEDLNTILTARVKAEEDLAKTEIERDEALEALATQRETEAARRARVDALGIKASAGYTIVTGGVDLNGDGRYDPEGVPGEVLPVSRSSTNTIANYQGAQSRLFDLPAESLSVSAFRFGSTVSITATVRQGLDGKQLFRVSSRAGAGDATSITHQFRVPGGHTQQIVLMTDIGAPETTLLPTGLTRTLFDSDYLVYGAWLMRPDSAGGTAYAAAFATGNDLFDPITTVDENGIVELVGKATYKGSAVGFFAEQYVNVDTGASGTFTAATELLADFDAGTVNNDVAGGIISGTITDFVRSDGVSVNWLINLGALDLGAVDGVPSATNTAVPSTAAGGFTPGTTSGSASGVPWTGEWGVQFAGDDALHAARHPTGVVGTFGAQYDSPIEPTGVPPTTRDVARQAFITVIGAFGARKE